MAFSLNQTAGFTIDSVNFMGSVTAYHITTPGSGYYVQDDVTLAIGNQRFCSIDITSVDGSGAITGSALNFPGWDNTAGFIGAVRQFNGTGGGGGSSGASNTIR